MGANYAEEAERCLFKMENVLAKSKRGLENRRFKVIRENGFFYTDYEKAKHLVRQQAIKDIDGQEDCKNMCDLMHEQYSLDLFVRSKWYQMLYDLNVIGRYSYNGIRYELV